MSPFQLAAVGVDGPCIFQAKERPGLVGPEQAAEGPHLQVVVAAAAVQGDTCH